MREKYNTKEVIEEIKKKRIGETGFSNSGQKMTIIRYVNNRNIDVQFEDGTIVPNKSYLNFRNGEIENPNFIHSKRRIGETAIANCGMKMTIIRYGSSADIDVQFEDGTIVKNKTYRSFKNGNIKCPSLCKVGETSTANCGLKMTIIRYGRYDDIDIQFEDGAIVTNKYYTSFKKGRIKHPTQNKIGEISIANCGMKMTIIHFRDSKDIDIKFEDGTIVTNKTYQNFKKGAIGYPAQKKGK